MPGDVDFGGLYKPLLNYSPATPVSILKQCVNNAYSRALTAYDWSEMKGTGAIQLPAPYTTGTVSLTNGSDQVTGALTVWTSAAHALKQLVVGGFAPFLDIESVESNTSLTLVQPYAGPDVTGATYAIQDVLIIPPSDFQHYTSFADMTIDWWVLDRSMTQEVVDRYDPRRSAIGPRPIQLVPAAPSPFAASLGRPRYELWPRPSTEVRYFFRYQRKKVLLVEDTDTIIAPFRGDIIREGAFEDLSLWPGTKDATNPYHEGDFIARASYHAKRFVEGCALANREDREVASKTVQYRDDYKKLFPLGAMMSPTTVTVFTGTP